MDCIHIWRRFLLNSRWLQFLITQFWFKGRGKTSRWTFWMTEVIMSMQHIHKMYMKFESSMSICTNCWLMDHGSTVLCLYHKLFDAFVGIILEVVNRKLFGWFQYLICIWWHETKNLAFVILLEPCSIQISSTAAHQPFQLFLLDKLISYHPMLLDSFSPFSYGRDFLVCLHMVKL